MHKKNDPISELQTLNRIIAGSIKSPNIKIILRKALEEAIKVCGLEYGVLYSITKENKLNQEAGISISDVKKEAFLNKKIKIGKDLCIKSVSEPQPLILSSSRDVLKYSNAEIQGKEAIRFYASFPINLKTKRFGILCIYSYSDKKPTERNLKFVETLTAIISLILENKNQKQNLQNEIVELKNKILELKKSGKETLRKNKQLSDLSASLQNTREEERKELARKIHDDLGQQLGALKIDISILKKRLTNDKGAKEKIADMMSIVNNAMIAFRKISLELRPEVTDEIGLPDALDYKVKKFYETTGVKCHLLIDAGYVALPLHVSMNIFRIIQESLNNITKHAEATEVDLHLKKKRKNMIVSIKDNGIGFNPEKIKKKITFGIIGMQERAKMIGGELQIQSHEGKGTRVELKVPII